MKYMGSKNRIAKHILPIVLNGRGGDQWYVEPFLGGANMIDKVGGKRLGGELNNYIAEMWKALISGWTPPVLDKATYHLIRAYKGTTRYKDAFDHDSFWQWCRDMVFKGHRVFVSEYRAPDDFACLWRHEVKSSLSANGKAGGNKTSVERLFQHRRAFGYNSF